jgi:hypothetical protein
MLIPGCLVGEMSEAYRFLECLKYFVIIPETKSKIQFGFDSKTRSEKEREREKERIICKNKENN